MGKAHHYSTRLPSQRQLRVGELIRRALSEILIRTEISHPILESRPITITEVQVSSDLKIAKIYFLPLGGEDVENITDALMDKTGELRRVVSRRVALKFAPRLQFYPDHSFDQMEKIQKILDTPCVRKDLEIK